MKVSIAFLILACAAPSAACNSSTSTPTETPAEPTPTETEAQDQENTAQVDEPAEHSGHEETAPEADGHDGHDHGPLDHILADGDYSAGDLVAQPGASVGDTATCPVSGDVFVVTEDSPFFEHEGANVYFSCAQCVRRFQRDPAAYLSAANAAPGSGLVEVAADGTRFDPPVAKDRVPTGTWICDMGTVHYASQEQGDGSCPICGMHLAEH